jgi:carbonic anhydrase
LVAPSSFCWNKACPNYGKVNPGNMVKFLDAAIDINVENVVNQLETSEPVLSELVEEGRLTIVGARYHLDSGVVEIFE